MSAIKLKGVFFGEASGAIETLSTSSLASMVEEVNQNGTNGLAYRVDWGGCKLGYLPERDTLVREYKKAKAEGDMKEADSIKDVGLAVNECREDIKRDKHNLARVWMCKVCKVVKKGGEIDEIWITWGA